MIINRSHCHWPCFLPLALLLVTTWDNPAGQFDHKCGVPSRSSARGQYMGHNLLAKALSTQLAVPRVRAFVGDKDPLAFFIAEAGVHLAVVPFAASPNPLHTSEPAACLQYSGAST